MISRVGSAIVISLALYAAWGLFSVHVLNAAPAAIPAPLQTNIVSVDNYRNVIEDNDLLVVAHYQVEFLALPTKFISQTFFFKVIDASGAELARVSPTVYVEPANNLNNGYGQGIVSVYFSAADAPTWEASLTYTLAGNPFDFVAPIPSASTTVETWTSACTTHVLCAVALRAGVVENLQLLQLRWDELTGYTALLYNSIGGTVLTQTAETYVDQAIPGIRQMAPALYFARVAAIAPTPNSFDTSYRDTLADRLDGTAGGTGFDAFGVSIGSTGDVGRSIFAFIVFIGMFSLGMAVTKNARVALMVGGIVMVAGAGVGIPPLNGLAVVGLFAALFSGVVLFYQRS